VGKGDEVWLKRNWLAGRFGQFAPLVVEICSIAWVRLICTSTAAFLAAFNFKTTV